MLQNLKKTNDIKEVKTIFLRYNNAEKLLMNWKNDNICSMNKYVIFVYFLLIEFVDFSEYV